MDTPAPARPSLFKRLLKWVGISLATLVLLVALGPTLMPTGWIRDLIAEKTRLALGAPVTVGRISLGWLSGATLEGIEVPNASGYSGAPLLRIGRLRVEPDLPSLLSDRIHVRRIEVTGIEASVERRAKDGAWNAQALAVAPSPSAAPASPAKPPSVRVDVIVVEGMARVLGNGKALEVRGLRIDASSPDLVGGVLQAKLKAVLSGGGASWTALADADTQGGALKADLSLDGKGLAGLLEPLADLPVRPDLGSGRIRLEARLKDGVLHAELKEARLSGLQAGGLFTAEAADLSLRADGPLSNGEMKIEADLSCRDASIPCPGGRTAKVASVRISPKLTLDLAGKSVSVESCPLQIGPFSGSVEGKVEGPAYSLKQTLKGNLSEIPQAVSGLVPEGSTFTGALDSLLEISGSGTVLKLEGATAIPGFSIRAPNVGKGPKVDLRVEEKLSWADGKLGIESLKISAGPALDFSVSGSLEDPERLGQVNLAGSARADLGALAAVVAGYFQDAGLDCKGRIEGDFLARGNEGQATVKGKLALSGGRFRGGVFGTSPLDVPEAHVALDLDMDRGAGLRVNVRTAEIRTPYISAAVNNGFLNGADLKADLDVSVKDLDAACRLLKGPVSALQPWDLGGSGRLRASVSGSLTDLKVAASGTMERLSVSGSGVPPVSSSRVEIALDASGSPAGGWKVADLSLRAEGLKDPLGLGQARISVKDASLDPAKRELKAKEVGFDSGLASGTWAGTACWDPLSLDGDLTLAEADLGRLGAGVSGKASASVRVRGNLNALVAEGKLSGKNLKAAGLPGSDLSCGPFRATASLGSRSLALESLGVLEAPGLGVTRLTLASASVKDWIALTGIEVRGLALEADTAPWKAWIPSQVKFDGPVSVKASSVSGSLKNLSFDIAVDARAEGQALSVAASGSLAPDAVTLRKADLGFGEYRVSLRSGSVIPLDPAKDANLEIDRTTVDLSRLPMLKGFSGKVTVEGSVRGPLSDPKRLDGSLSVGLDRVAAKLGEIPFTADGELKASRKAVSAPNLRLTVRGEPVTVTADVKDPLEAPSGSVTVNGGAFDLDKLLGKPATGVPGRAPPPPAPAAKGRTDLKLTGLLPSPLDKADLVLTFTLKELVYKGNKLSALDARTSLKRQHLVTTIAAAVNEGTVKIGLDLDASQKNPPLVATLEAKEVRLDLPLPPVKFILPMFAAASVSGKLTLEPLRLEGHGASWDALQADLHTVRDGHLKVGSGQIVNSPLLGGLGRALRIPLLSGSITFDSIEAAFRIGGRRVENLGTVVRTSHGDIRAEGWVDFDGNLENRTTMSGGLMRTGNEEWDKGLEIVMGKGGVLTDHTILEPRTRLDMESILKEVAKETARRLLEEKAKEGLGKALQDLFGR